MFSVALMIADYRDFHFSRIRTYLSVFIAPLQYTVSWPIEAFDWVTENISKQQNLIKENASLRAQTLMLQGKLQQILIIQKENSQLRALLQSTAKHKEEFTIAQLLAVSTKPYSSRVIIDKGIKDHVYLGQPALDARGVMGQIIQVGPTTSQIMLITDVNSAVPVQVYRNGLRAIVVGTGSRRYLGMINIADTADIKVGDLLITSGLGMRYPEGYPVGMVIQIEQKPGEHFAKIFVKPSAHLLQSRQILLVWQKLNKQQKALQDEFYSALNRKKMGSLQ